MIEVNGEKAPGLEFARTTFFGHESITGIAEVAFTNSDLKQDRFLKDGVIPIIGEERMVRTLGFVPKTQPDMFDYIRMIAPSGLITFGVNSEGGASGKIHGTHMDIILREYGMGNGPVAPFLGVAVEKVYEDTRDTAVEFLARTIGSKEIKMSKVEDTLVIKTL